MVASVGTPGAMKSIWPERIASIMAVAFDSVVHEHLQRQPCFSACFSRNENCSITMKADTAGRTAWRGGLPATSARGARGLPAVAATTMSVRSKRACAWVFLFWSRLFRMVRDDNAGEERNDKEAAAAWR
jgi:hypothetical protein